MNRLEAIKARADAATEGPWCVRGLTHDNFIAAHSEGDDDCEPVLYACDDHLEGSSADKAFVAHARTDIPWFQARVEEMAAALRKVPLLMIRAKDAAAIEAALAALGEPEKP